MFGFHKKTVRERLQQGVSDFSAKRHTYRQYNEGESYKSWEAAISWSEQEIEKGKPVRDVLVTIFCGHLLDCMLKVFGESKASRKEWGGHADWDGTRPHNSPPPKGLVTLDRYISPWEEVRNMTVNTHQMISEGLREENEKLRARIKELEAQLAQRR